MVANGLKVRLGPFKKKNYELGSGSFSFSPFIVPIYALSTHGYCMKYWLYYKYYTSPTQRICAGISIQFLWLSGRALAAQKVVGSIPREHT